MKQIPNQNKLSQEFNLLKGHLPEVRRKLSPAALRTFFNITSEQHWNLTTGQMIGLLGFPNRQTFNNWRHEKNTTLSFDILTRISLIIGIYKALHILYPEENFANTWIKMPNSNPLFQGKTAIDFMCTGSIDNLFKVRRLLDARRGSWS